MKQPKPNLNEAAKAFLAEHDTKITKSLRRKLRARAKSFERRRWLEEKAAAPKAAPMPREDVEQSVYVIGCAGHPVKVGIAADPERRLRGIQTGFPHRLRIYWTSELLDNAREIERQAHTKLSDYRLNGEWFDVDPRDAIEIIKGLLA